MIALKSKLIKYFIISEITDNFCFENLSQNELILIGNFFLHLVFPQRKEHPLILYEESGYILKKLAPHSQDIGPGGIHNYIVLELVEFLNLYYQKYLFSLFINILYNLNFINFIFYLIY